MTLTERAKRWAADSDDPLGLPGYTQEDRDGDRSALARWAAEVLTRDGGVAEVMDRVDEYGIARHAVGDDDAGEYCRDLWQRVAVAKADVESAILALVAREREKLAADHARLTSQFEKLADAAKVYVEVMAYWYDHRDEFGVPGSLAKLGLSHAIDQAGNEVKS